MKSRGSWLKVPVGLFSPLSRSDRDREESCLTFDYTHREDTNFRAVNGCYIRIGYSHHEGLRIHV